LQGELPIFQLRQQLATEIPAFYGPGAVYPASSNSIKGKTWLREVEMTFHTGYLK
jgi:hypothetical protein